jgi:hypothetical protein
VLSYTTPSTSGITEGTNLYFTDARARAAISVTGSGSYNATTGVITVTGGVTSVNTRTGAVTLISADVTDALGFTPYNATNPSGYITTAQARAAVSASGSLSYNSTTGVFSYTTPSSSGITEGSNLYYTDARARAAVSATGSLSYNSTTGVFSYTTPSTSGIAEGTNLYYTDARAISANTSAIATAKSEAISAAATDATAKANAAQAAAIAAVTNGAGAAFDTLKEIQDAMATDQELAAAIAGLTIGNATQTISAGTGLSGGGSFTANQTSPSTVTLSLATAGTAGTYTKVTTDAYGRVTSGTTLSAGDIPSLSGLYLPLSGGTLSGALNIGTVIGSRGTSVSISGSTNSSPLAAKSSDYATVFGILPHSGSWTYLSTGVYYNTGAWTHASANTDSALLGLSGGTGARWFASSNSSASWNVASDAQLWNQSGVWTGSLNAATNAQVNSNVILHAGNYSSYALPLTGGTVSGVITSSISNGTVMNMAGQSDSFGYNGTAGLGTYIKGTGSTYVYGGGSFFDGSTTRAILHAANYNSYAPTLIGGGASGTWNISITGSAASANSVFWQNISSGTRQNYGLGFQPSGTDYAGFYFSKSTSSATASDAGYFLIKGSGDNFPPYTEQGITIVSDANSLNLFARGSTLVSGGNAWVRMGTSSGETFRLMSDYSLSINSSRAPIFYDSNNTAYFTDPASRSRQASIDFGDGGYYIHAGSWGMRNTTPYGYIEFGPANGGHAHIYTNLSNFYFNAMLQVNGGSQMNTSDMRANIFYDQQDTSYYVDPNSNSRLVNLGLGNVTPDTRLSISGDSHFVGTLHLGGTPGSVGSWGSRDYTTSGNRYFNANSYTFDNVGYGNNWSVTLNGGTGQASSSLRAPIFYDSNNTGFYLDPASTSYLNAIELASGKIFTSNNGSGSSIEWYVRPDGNNTYLWRHIYGGSSTGFGTGAGGYGVYCSHLGGDYSAIFSPSGFVTAPYSFRSPIFYDSNNTAYYVDPNGNSALTTAIFYVNGSSDITLTSAGTNASMIKAGSGDELYIGGNNTWQMRFSGANVLMDNGGYLLNGESIRSPIFYDSQDTGYYVNPNGVSYLYQLTLAGGGYFRPNTWIQMDGTYGMYWPGATGVPHWHANDSTYGPMQLSGIKNSYSGIRLPSSNNATIGMFDSGGNGGLYNYTYWVYYWSVGNACLGVRTSSTSSAYAMYVDGGIYSTGNVVAYSDARKKKEIVTVDNALATVNKLRGVFYKRIETNDEKIDTNKRQIGVIAQEVNEVLPEAVTYAKDVDEYGVQYGNMAGLFIEAIKELTSTVEKLNSKIQELEKKVNS